MPAAPGLAECRRQAGTRVRAVSHGRSTLGAAGGWCCRCWEFAGERVGWRSESLWDMVGCFARGWESWVTSAVPNPPACSAQPWLLGDPARSPAYDKTKQTLKDFDVVLAGGGCAFGVPHCRPSGSGGRSGTLGAGRAAGQLVSPRPVAACCPARAGAERGEPRFVCPPRSRVPACSSFIPL